MNAEPKTVDVVVRGGAIVTMDAERRVIRDGAVAIKGNKIIAVGKDDLIFANFQAPRIIGDSNAVVFPGLIDTHNHPVHFLSKGMIDDMHFPMRWRERVWPYESGLTPEETAVATTGTCLEMIRRGTTCFSDPGSFHPLSVAQAMNDIGIRGIVSRITWDVYDESAPRYNDTTSEALYRGEELVNQFTSGNDETIRAWFSLVRSAHVSPELARETKLLADRHNVGIHAHLSTTRAEFDASIEKWGTTPVGRYRDLGVLGPSTQLVHMGALSDDDILSLKDYDVTVSHCPSASMFGGFGCVAHGRFPELVSKGVRVVLGSDACAVSRFLDMVRIMWLAACAHKDVKIDPTVIGAHKAMEMATIDGAKALMWDDKIGSIEVGKLADIVVADTDRIEWQPNPFADPVANLVYSSDGSCVRTVMIDGQIVMENRVFARVDTSSFYKHAGKISAKALSRMGLDLRTVWPAH